jgi:hypothetical protein
MQQSLLFLKGWLYEFCLSSSPNSTRIFGEFPFAAWATVLGRFCQRVFAPCPLTLTPDPYPLPSWYVYLPPPKLPTFSYCF